MKNRYTVTWKLYCSWAMERLFSGIGIVIRLAFCLLGGLAFGRIFSGGFPLLYLVLALVCLYFAFFRDLRRAKKEYDTLAEEYGEDDWRRTIALEEDQIVLEEGTACKTYLYSEIKNAYERKDQFCLSMRDGTLLRLYKNAFEAHTADECWILIEKKMDEAGDLG